MTSGIIMEIKGDIQIIFQVNTLNRGEVITLIGMRILHIIEETIFRSHQQVWDAVFVPVYDGGVGGVAGKNSVCYHSLVTEEMRTFVF